MARKTEHTRQQILSRAYANAQKKELLRPELDPALCALDSYTFIKGLVNLWLSDSDGTIIRDKTTMLIDNHIAMRYR